MAEQDIDPRRFESDYERGPLNARPPTHRIRRAPYVSELQWQGLESNAPVGVPESPTNRLGRLV